MSCSKQVLEKLFLRFNAIYFFLFLLINLLVGNTYSFSQQERFIDLKELSEKYNIIYDRLESDFIAIGEGKGTCIPAVLIDTTVAWKKALLPQKGMIRFGDGPVYQGFYLAILATEYELSSKKNESILDKMHFVLKSKIRLDSIADINLYNKKSHSLNGFYIRDDIDEKTASQLFKQPYFKSDLVSLDDPEKNAMSQDQVIGWMMGYVFTIKALKDQKNKKAIKLKNQAEKQLHVLLNFMKDSKWVIRDPNNKIVKRGAVAKFQSYPMTQIGRIFLADNFETRFSVGLGKLSWKFSELGFKWGRRVTFVDPFKSKKRYLIYGDVNNSMMLKLAALSNTWKNKRLASASEQSGLEIYELINAYLHDRKPIIDAKVIIDMLNGMTLKGAFYYSDKLKAPNGWASRDRWSHPGDAYSGSEQFKGNYPGLDFLLLCNLYLLTYYE